MFCLDSEVTNRGGGGLIKQQSKLPPHHFHHHIHHISMHQLHQSSALHDLHPIESTSDKMNNVGELFHVTYYIERLDASEAVLISKVFV